MPLKGSLKTNKNESKKTYKKNPKPLSYRKVFSHGWHTRLIVTVLQGARLYPKIAEVDCCPSGTDFAGRKDA